MSKLNPSFIDEIEADIKKAQSEAEIIKDTGVVNFQPIYTEDVPKEVVDKVIDLINRNGAIVHAGTSNVAFEQYPETKRTEWTGVMDMGSVQITAMHQMSDSFEANGKTENSYGNCDLFFDYKHSEDLNGWFDRFMEQDSARCEALFKEAPKSE